MELQKCPIFDGLIAAQEQLLMTTVEGNANEARRSPSLYRQIATGVVVNRGSESPV
jgi:hypothetical protein